VTQDPPEYRGDPAAVLGSGSRVAGYRLEEQVGAGGMAVVYRAGDERLGRLVALKIMAPAMAADAMFRQRFTRESRAAAAVDHPHIIPVYEAGEADGVLFIAMRFVGGGDVGSLLRREGPLPSAGAASIISPVASALDAAHAAGLVHRDVKPANMLLDTHPDRPDHVYLSDFGLSKGVQSGRLTASGQFLGTPDYIAPEQIEGLPVDGRADQYALACVAFELLTAAVIFARSEGWATVWAHLNSPPPRLSSARPDLPPAADEVLARALAKAPQDRYANCQQFADALREALGLVPYHLGSGAAPATGGTGNEAVRAAAPDTAGLPSPTAGLTAPVHAATEAADEAAVARTAAVTPRTAQKTHRHRAGRSWPRRRYAPIALAGAVVVAAAVTAAVLVAPAHHAPPAVPPLVPIAAFTPPRTPGPGNWQYVSSVAFSPDGRTLVTGLTPGTGGVADPRRSPGETFLWNVATGRRTFTLAGAGDGGEAFSADGSVLAAAGGYGQDSLYFWDPATGQRGGDLGDVHEPITDVAFSPDDKALTAEDITGVVHLWSLESGQLIAALGQREDPSASDLAISPDSQTLATLQNSGYRDEVYLWNLGTRRIVAAMTSPDDSIVQSVAFSPDGKTIAIGGRETSLWNTATRKIVATLTDPGGYGVTTVAFSPDGGMLAAGDFDGKTYLWELRTRTLVAVLANPGGATVPQFAGEDRNAIASIAFSPDGKTLVTSGTNGSAYLWRIP
jgi:DNA-binding beta-propeller fold protein YncE